MVTLDADVFFEQQERMLAGVLAAVESHGERIDALTRAVDAQRDAQPAAIAAAIGAVVTDRELIGRAMEVFGEVAQERAASAAGRGLLGLLKTVFSKWLVIGLIVLLVAKVGGIEAARAAWRLLTGGAP